jgi:N-hydroxyarylamine O-acetyltransferase
MHTHDELRVHPADLVVGHHYTSTYPQSHFRRELMLTRHTPGQHTSVRDTTVTVRRPGGPTEHRTIDLAEVRDLLHELAIPLTADEESGLFARLSDLRHR